MTFPSRLATEGLCIDIEFTSAGTFPNITNEYGLLAYPRTGFNVVGDGTPDILGIQGGLSGDVAVYGFRGADYTYYSLNYLGGDENLQGSGIYDRDMFVSGADVYADGITLTYAIVGYLDNLAGGTIATSTEDAVTLDVDFPLGLSVNVGVSLNSTPSLSPNSTTLSPKALCVFNPATVAQTENRVWAVEISNTATTTLYNYYKFPLNYTFLLRGVCVSSADTWQFSNVTDDTAVKYCVISRASLQTFVTAGGGTWDYVHYKAEIDDPVIQAILDANFINGSGYATYSVIGTDAGFVLSYVDPDTSDFKAILVNATWTTFKRLHITAGDASTQTMLDEWTSAIISDATFTRSCITTKEGIWYFTNTDVPDEVPFPVLISSGVGVSCDSSVGSAGSTGIILRCDDGIFRVISMEASETRMVLHRYEAPKRLIRETEES